MRAPDPISIAHASLAQIVFCLTTTIAVATAPGWRRSYTSSGGVPDDATLRKVAAITTALVYVQIVIGATMRHTDAGLAIPDFPWAFGRLVPPHWNAQIAIHFAHRVGALIVTAVVLATTGHVLYHHRRRHALARPAVALIGLVALQITLGALTVLSRKQHIINSLHVVNGGLVLVTSLVLTLRAHRARFPLAESLGPTMRGTSANAAPAGHGGTAAGARA